MDLYLAVVAGVPREQAVRLPIGHRLTLGRSSSNHVQLPSDRISKKNCAIRRDKDGVYVASLEGRNRVRLNGVSVNLLCDTPMRVGDDVRIADIRITLVPADASWLAWNDGTVRKMAQVIYDGRRFGDLPLLADALEDAGCTDTRILAHCRGPGPHVRGCWIVDLLLGKN